MEDLKKVSEPTIEEEKPILEPTNYTEKVLKEKYGISDYCEFVKEINKNPSDNAKILVLKDIFGVICDEKLKAIENNGPKHHEVFYDVNEVKKYIK